MEMNQSINSYLIQRGIGDGADKWKHDKRYPMCGRVLFKLTMYITRASKNVWPAESIFNYFFRNGV